jgi:hypothetical protein
MSPDPARACVLLRAELAHRLAEPSLDWLEETRPLASAGIASLDLVAALAHLQRDAGLELPESFAIDARTSLSSLALALAASSPPDAG